MISSADLSTILNRILDTAADNLRIAKILVQMGLDPNNITYDALFDRLLDIVLANITLANMFALVGATRRVSIGVGSDSERPRFELFESRPQPRMRS